MEIKILNEDVQVAFVDGRNRFAALHELLDKRKYDNWMETGLCLSLETMQKGTGHDPSEIVFDGRSSNNLGGLVLCDNCFLNTLLTLK